MMANLYNNMMSSLNSAVIIYTEFLQNVAKYSCFILYEGKQDSPFYKNFLNTSYKNKFKNPWLKKCKGKLNILQCINLIEKSLINSDKKVMFLMDSDFDKKSDYCPSIYNSVFDDDVYFTSGYSIENYWCFLDSIEKIILMLTDLNTQDKEYLKIRNDYLNFEKSCNKTYLRLNKCLYIIRKIRNSRNSFPNLKRFDLFKKYDFRMNYPRIKDLKFTDIETLLKCSPFTKQELSQANAFFKRKKLYKYGRGHYQIIVLNTFLDFLYTKYLKSKKKNFTFEFSPSNELENKTLSCVHYPSCLDSFFKSHL